MSLKIKGCEHLTSVEINFSIDNKVCQECIELDDSWVHLRMCTSCGHIGCCDSSKNKHATSHYKQSEHPVIVSAESGENWAWCYVHQLFKQL